MKVVPTDSIVAREFFLLVQDLSPEQRALEFDGSKEELANNIMSAKDFCNAVFYLTPAQILTLCNMLKERLPTIIKTVAKTESSL